jgi:hypothetical protein
MCSVQAIAERQVSSDPERRLSAWWCQGGIAEVSEKKMATSTRVRALFILIVCERASVMMLA